MAIDRTISKQTFDQGHAPPWTCPRCKRGILAIQEDSVSYVASFASKKRRSDDPWSDLANEEGRFTGLLECSQATCRESVVVAGDYAHEPSFDDEGQHDGFERYLVPRYVNPVPHIIPIPNNCPPLVSEDLIRSFKLFFIDPNSAANKVRSAVEHLMDFLRLSKRARGKSGRLQQLSLRQRIERFRQTDLVLGDMLLAAKWLGNSGSHKGDRLSKDDVLDALELVDHVLHEIIAKRPKVAANLAREINRRKGPRSKPARRTNKHARQGT